jgi:hypothetical protein
MAQIPGVGRSKLERYGAQFLGVLAAAAPGSAGPA